jgi:hypothetical protein
VTALLLLLVFGAAHAQEGEDEREFIVIESPFHADETACVENADGAACFRAAQGWHSGRGVDKPDKFQAENLYRAGCTFQHAESCMAAGYMYLRLEAGMWIDAKTGVVNLDMGEAANFFRSACDFGLLTGCGLRGDLLTNPSSLLPDPSARADNLKSDFIAARQSYADGCNGGDINARLELPEDDGLTGVDLRSCIRLGEIFEKPLGVVQNLGTAAYYYERACWTEGGEDYCDKADAVAEQAKAQGESDGKPKPLELDGVGKTDGRPDPSSERFEDASTGIRSLEKGDKPHRFSIETAWGVRWSYVHPQLNPPIAGLKIRVGLTAWFGLLGIAADFGILTDRPFNADLRRYGRFHGAVGPKFALPIPSVLPIPSTTYFEVGVSGIFGAATINGDDFAPNYGMRQMAQFTLSSPQDRGPRQWGGLRFEQQQEWWAGILGPLHSSQVVVVFGATWGGWGPRWKKLQGK